MAAIVLAVASLLGGSCSVLGTNELTWPVTVVRGGMERTVDVPEHATVADALEQADVAPYDGQLLAAASGEVLRPNGDEAVVRIGGRPVARDRTVTGPTTVEVVDGVDTVEATRTEEVPVAPTGMPEVLRHVHHSGEPGVEQVTIGVESGEEVRRSTLVEAVPVRRATGKVLALTFDDGPHPVYTAWILEVLRLKGVPATFCSVGTEIERHADLVRRIVAEGHQVCNHTVDHVKRLEEQPREVIEAQIGGGHRILEETTGVAPPYYRPPGGTLGAPTTEVAADHGEVVLHWAIDPADWRRPTGPDLLAAIVNSFEPGGIVLLHDGGGERWSTVAALPAIIDYARALGYTFTVPLSRRAEVLAAA